MNIKKQVFFFFLSLCLIIPQTISQESPEPFSYEELTIMLNIKSTLYVIKQREAAVLNYVKAKIDTIPEETSTQRIIDASFSPAWKEENGTTVFIWENPDNEELDKLNIEAGILLKTKISRPKVTEKVSFPLQDIDKDIQQYLAETEMIDYNNEKIKTLATSLADGEDDAYLVAVKTAEWVQQNILYNLTTMTADVAQQASWVLENRYGVCDEITNLYIALLRAIGIPARFVIGISYTNSPIFEEQWNPHGWAEVYLPDYGWIPFDVTNNQFGFVDATHIKFSDALDANQASIAYEWSGKWVKVEASDIEFEAEIKEHGKISKLPVELNAELYKDNVGFGSFDFITATIKNTAGYYLPIMVSFAAPQEISIIGSQKKNLLLKPYEEKSIDWLLQVKDDLDERYEYIFTTIIYIANESVEIQLDASKRAVLWSKETLEKIISNNIEEEAKTYSKNITFNCNISQEIFYPEHPERVTCIIKNKGNILQKQSVCFEEQCKDIELYINEEKEITYQIKNITIGNHILFIQSHGNESKKSAVLQYTVLDEPEIEIREIEYKNETEWDTDFPLAFFIERTSFQALKNLKIRISAGNSVQEIQIMELRDIEKIELILETKNFRKEKTPIVITVTYTDLFGKNWQKEEIIYTRVANLTFWKKLELVALDIFGL